MPLLGKRKFDIAYMIVKEKMAFTKMQPLCNLEERHGIKLGSGYKNDQACATFVEYIALEQKERLQDALGKCRFFSLQADGTTDAGNIEIELFLVLFFELILPTCIKQCYSASTVTGQI